MIESDYDYRPEGKEGATIGECEQCGCSITEGETYYEFKNGEIVCDDCLLEHCYENYRVC